jgi:hypothetical protein
MIRTCFEQRNWPLLSSAAVALVQVRVLSRCLLLLLLLLKTELRLTKKKKSWLTG